MREEEYRTPGVGMTEQQCMQVLDELQVKHVVKPEGGRIMLSIAGPGGGETLTVTELKGRLTHAIAELEDRKNEIEQNAFASMLVGQLPTGGDRSVEVKYLKRNDQLTPEEEEEKRRLLLEVSAEMSHHRTIIGAMNYLQVHLRELQPKLLRRELPLEMILRGTDGAKLRWTKGIKSAALYCLKESQKAPNAGKRPLELCREFLSRYTIDGDEDYTPEQLYGNMQQIVQLDRGE